jgi:hypothetical protein
VSLVCFGTGFRPEAAWHRGCMAYSMRKRSIVLATATVLVTLSLLTGAKLIIRDASLPKQDSNSEVSSEPDAPLIESAPAYSTSDAQALAEKVLPLVEEVAGRRFKSIPTVKLVTRAEFLSETVGTDEQQKPGGEGDSRQNAGAAQPRNGATASSSFTYYADYAFGAYEPSNRTVYLLPGNFKPRLDRAEVPSQYHQAILTLIIAHELTHALQSQEFALEALEQSEGRGKRATAPANVIRAVNEGHAMFVMSRVAEKLGLHDAVPQFRKTIAVGLVLDRNPVSPRQNEKSRELERSIYEEGERFIESHYNRGGTEEVWQVLKNPPSVMSDIKSPGKLVSPDTNWRGRLNSEPNLPLAPGTLTPGEKTEQAE